MAETTATQDAPAANPAEVLAKSLTDLTTSVGAIAKQVEDQRKENSEIKKTIDDLKKPLEKFGAPFVMTGESPNTSRPISFQKAAAYSLGLINRDSCKVELELSDDLRKYYPSAASLNGQVCLPFATQLMPCEDDDEAVKQQGFGMPRSLIAKCNHLTTMRYDSIDKDMFAWMQKRFGIQKDLTVGDDGSGGTLVALPAQGELIDLLRPMEVMGQAGVPETGLPAQGAIRYPKLTSDPTVAAYAEGGTITESTPGTGELTLSAKQYSALVDLSAEFLRFTNMGAEAWLRQILARRTSIQTDAAMLDGVGGTSIKGLITYASINVRVATTTGANGDTFEVADPALMVADLATDNVDVRRLVWAMRPTMWSALTNRRGDYGGGAGTGGFLLTYDRFGAMPNTLLGYPVVRSTQIANNRDKGSGTTLTYILLFNPNDMLIGRSGVIEIAMTDSDASKFQANVKTMRSTIWMDFGPLHEESAVFCDDLLES